MAIRRGVAEQFVAGGAGTLDRFLHVRPRGFLGGLIVRPLRNGTQRGERGRAVFLLDLQEVGVGGVAIEEGLQEVGGHVVAPFRHQFAEVPVDDLRFGGRALGLDLAGGLAERTRSERPRGSGMRRVSPVNLRAAVLRYRWLAASRSLRRRARRHTRFPPKPLGAANSNLHCAAGLQVKQSSSHATRSSNVSRRRISRCVPPVTRTSAARRRLL